MRSSSITRVGGPVETGRPLVAALFVASLLLSIVSWYTTYRGMTQYLSPWFAFLASLGIQSALVLVAWLSGVSEGRRAPLLGVYAATAAVSIAFSYVSLHGWFAARERPAEVERRLFDELVAAAGRVETEIQAAIVEGEKHALALAEMAAAERAHGFISRAEDADPWLSRVRMAVAHEAATYATSYPEGAGAGLRYTAFDRHAALARQTLERLRGAAGELAAARGRLRPSQSSEEQLATLRAAWDRIPWTEIRDTRHTDIAAITLPAYGENVDHAASEQEDLLIAFRELGERPQGRSVLALILAAFIDVIVFLLAWASGPFFFGSPESRWLAAAAALDATEPPLFVRGLLGKVAWGAEGMPRLAAEELTAGERQLCLVLAAHGLAKAILDDGSRAYVLDPRWHGHLLESLAEQGFALRATTPARARTAEPAVG